MRRHTITCDRCGRQEDLVGMRSGSDEPYYYVTPPGWWIRNDNDLCDDCRVKADKLWDDFMHPNRVPTTTVSVTMPPTGNTVSREAALRISRETLEAAEQERKDQT